MATQNGSHVDVVSTKKSVDLVKENQELQRVNEELRVQLKRLTEQVMWRSLDTVHWFHSILQY